MWLCPRLTLVSPHKVARCRLPILTLPPNCHVLPLKTSVVSAGWVDRPLPSRVPLSSCSHPTIKAVTKASGLANSAQFLNQVEVNACGAMRDIHSLNSVGIVVPVRLIHPGRNYLLETPKAGHPLSALAMPEGCTDPNRVQPLPTKTQRRPCLSCPCPQPRRLGPRYSLPGRSVRTRMPKAAVLPLAMRAVLARGRVDREGCHSGPSPAAGRAAVGRERSKAPVSGGPVSPRQ